MPAENPDRILPNTLEPMRTVTKYMKAPNLVFRACRTPDCKRVIGAWLLYEEVNKQYPEDKGWHPLPTPNPPAYAIRPIHGRGQGMVSTRKISRGEIILLERPIIMTPFVVSTIPQDKWATQEKMLLQLLYLLEPEDRVRLLQLSNCKPLNNEFGPLQGLYCTNTTSIGFPAPSGQTLYCDSYAALCLDISRVNHSCIPNAAYAIDPENVSFTLFAYRDIPANEEITISYVEDYRSCAERQQSLQELYSFNCTCAVCSAPPAAISESDKRRQYVESACLSMASMIQKWEDTKPGLKRVRARADIKTLLAVMRAMDEEGMYYQSEFFTAHLAKLYASLGDIKNFMKWGKDTLRIYELKKHELLEPWRVLVEEGARRAGKM